MHRIFLHDICEKFVDITNYKLSCSDCILKSIKLILKHVIYKHTPRYYSNRSELSMENTDI